jgi:hypothetical protein
MVQYEIKGKKWRAVSVTGSDIGWYCKDSLFRPSTSTGQIEKQSLGRRLAKRILEFRTWQISEHSKDKEITFQVSKKELGPD